MVRPGLIAVLGSVLLASCNTPPPRPWIRYRVSGRSDFTTDAQGQLCARLLGTSVTVDLGQPQTRVLAVVANPTTRPIEIRLGADAAAPRDAIGEVLLRPLSGPPPADAPGTLAYNNLQNVTIQPGWRGTFYVDTPLGRPVVDGQGFVLAVEARDAAGNRDRCAVPLTADLDGTIPADGRR